MNYPTYQGQPGPATGYAGGQPPQAPPYNPPSPQNYGQQPQQGYSQQQPQGQAPPQTQTWQGTGDPLAAGSRPSISWEVSRGVSVPFGTRRLLAVYEPPRVEQKKDFDTGLPAVYPDSGQPIWNIVVGVIDENGEPRGLYFGRPSAGQAALLEAQKNAGSRIEAGGLIDITLTGEKPNPEKPRMNPAKQFTAAWWTAPECRQWMTPPQLAALDRELAAAAREDALGGQGNGAAPQPPARPAGPPAPAPQQYTQPAPPPAAPQSYGTPQAPPQYGYEPPAQAPQQAYGPPQAPAQQYGPPAAPQQAYGPPPTVAGAQQNLAAAGLVAPAQPPPQGYGPPQGQQPLPPAPAQQYAPQAPAPAGPPLPGFSVGQLAALRAMTDEELMGLGHQPAGVRQAIAAAEASGALPGF